MPAPLLHALALAALTSLALSHGFTHEFTNWDDRAYVVDNPTIRALTLDTVVTAFSRFHVANYNPLHILSYAADHALWGLEPAGFFATSLALHIAAGALLHALARRWLASDAAAFFVAALFLLHPTRVESVVWLSQRKDVLSAVFVLAALLARDAAAASGARRRRSLAVTAWVFFVLACLSKSQVVGFPILLMAIDLYRRRPLAAALAAAAPYLAVSAVFCAVTLAAHEGEAQHGTLFPDCVLAPIAALPRYAAHILWPFGLSPYYDYPPGTFLEATAVAAGALIAAGLAWASWASWRRERFALVGIAWFLAFTLPVLGVVRINVRVADRYLYLAIAGPALVAARALLDARASRTARRGLAWAAATALAAMAAASAWYTPVFRDSEALWRRVLAVSPGSSLGHSNLAHHYLAEGRLDLAAAHYDADLAERPVYETSLLGRALIHEERGEHVAAEGLFARALELRPRSAKVRSFYAEFLARRGELERAAAVLAEVSPEERGQDIEALGRELERGLESPLPVEPKETLPKDFPQPDSS